MSQHDDYFNYLQTRSRLGCLYRQYWLYPRLVRFLQGRALDIGCGIGDMLGFRLGTVGVDINPRTVEYCKSLGLDAYLMESDRLPFDEASFDSVLLDNVLEHLEAPQSLLAEVRRVLRTNGTLLIGVPGHKGWASDADHKILYDEEALVACLKGVGYSCARVFHMPLVRSDWLSHHVRQYCIYGVFARV